MSWEPAGTCAQRRQCLKHIIATHRTNVMARIFSIGNGYVNQPQTHRVKLQHRWSVYNKSNLLPTCSHQRRLYSSVMPWMRQLRSRIRECFVSITIELISMPLINPSSQTYFLIHVFFRPSLFHVTQVLLIINVSQYFRCRMLRWNQHRCLVTMHTFIIVSLKKNCSINLLVK